MDESSSSMQKKIVKTTFKPGDKLIPLPEADFHYRFVNGAMFEVESVLDVPDEDKDIYVFMVDSKDKMGKLQWVDYPRQRKRYRPCFKVCSRHFRLATPRDIADYLMDQL